MISKKRLKELIKQKAIIWSSSWEEEVDLSLPCKIVKDGGTFALIIEEDKAHHPYYSLAFLEEDVKKAKWDIKFRDVERIETLGLPTWDELQEIFNHIIDDYYERCFTVNNNAYCLFVNSNVIEIEELGYSKIANEENYIEACKLFKKIFLSKGE